MTDRVQRLRTAFDIAGAIRILHDVRKKVVLLIRERIHRHRIRHGVRLPDRDGARDDQVGALEFRRQPGVRRCDRPRHQLRVVEHVGQVVDLVHRRRGLADALERQRVGHDLPRVDRGARLRVHRLVDHEFCRRDAHARAVVLSCCRLVRRDADEVVEDVVARGGVVRRRVRDGDTLAGGEGADPGEFVSDQLRGAVGRRGDPAERRVVENGTEIVGHAGRLGGRVGAGSRVRGRDRVFDHPAVRRQFGGVGSLGDRQLRQQELRLGAGDPRGRVDAIAVRRVARRGRSVRRTAEHHVPREAVASGCDRRRVGELHALTHRERAGPGQIGSRVGDGPRHRRGGVVVVGGVVEDSGQIIGDDGRVRRGVRFLAGVGRGDGVSHIVARAGVDGRVGGLRQRQAVAEGRRLRAHVDVAVGPVVDGCEVSPLVRAGGRPPMDEAGAAQTGEIDEGRARARLGAGTRQGHLRVIPIDGVVSDTRTDDLRDADAAGQNLDVTEHEVDLVRLLDGDLEVHRRADVDERAGGITAIPRSAHRAVRSRLGESDVQRIRVRPVAVDIDPDDIVAREVVQLVLERSGVREGVGPRVGGASEARRGVVGIDELFAVGRRGESGKIGCRRLEEEVVTGAALRPRTLMFRRVARLRERSVGGRAERGIEHVPEGIAVEAPSTTVEDGHLHRVLRAVLRHDPEAEVGIGEDGARPRCEGAVRAVLLGPHPTFNRRAAAGEHGDVPPRFVSRARRPVGGHGAETLRLEEPHPRRSGHPGRNGAGRSGRSSRSKVTRPAHGAGGVRETERLASRGVEEVEDELPRHGLASGGVDVEGVLSDEHRVRCIRLGLRWCGTERRQRSQHTDGEGDGRGGEAAPQRVRVLPGAPASGLVGHQNLFVSGEVRADSRGAPLWTRSLPREAAHIQPRLRFFRT